MVSLIPILILLLIAILSQYTVSLIKYVIMLVPLVLVKVSNRNMLKSTSSTVLGHSNDAVK